MNSATYDKRPHVEGGPRAACAVGWSEVVQRVQRACGGAGRRVLCVECYPGVRVDEVRAAFAGGLGADLVVDAADALRTPGEIERLLAPLLTDDPVFGRLSDLRLDAYLDPGRAAALRALVQAADHGLVLVIGTGAARLCDPDVMVYADLSRWEIQTRQRSGELGNLGAANASAAPARKYKRGFFADWRAADDEKRRVLPRATFVLDTHIANTPKLVDGEALRAGLQRAAARPLRLVPFFDPGPWGGQWMRRVCALPDGPPNYAWCFDCVPEENSLLLRFGDVDVELAALDLVFLQPAALLGPDIVEVLGAEFPIRFDLLDTMGGGDLSLQVHPQLHYIEARFGVPYTQDESYYLLDAAEDATVCLGVRAGAAKDDMARDLVAAQSGGPPFPVERWVNRWPAKRHDHFSIPAGTVHCSGRNAMVLEISATPYIFTFKLWDWGRLGMDGAPRPIHLEHGLANIRFDRDTAWVRAQLIDQIAPLGRGDGWRAERTGLHEATFIDTHRHWFTGPVEHDTGGTVNVLNLVQGDAVVVESPTGAFAPFEVHYAETFIVPAAVGRYTITPRSASSAEHATIKAFVRPGALDRLRTRSTRQRVSVPPASDRRA